MGQYHKLVNLDKKEFVHPHRIGNGMKLLEQVGFERSTSTALFMLLACSNGRGGGDFNDHELIGRWAGDRIAIIGDYSEYVDIPGINAEEIYKQLEEDSSWKDISIEVQNMLNMEF